MKISVKRTLIALCCTGALLTCSITAMANNCSKLVVNLITKPGVVCQLVPPAKRIRGNIVWGSVPTQITSNVPGVGFTMQQSAGYGPDEQIKYRCDNGKTMTIESQQNYCLTEAGDITGKTDNPHSAHYTLYPGSWGKSIAGMIAWTLG